MAKIALISNPQSTGNRALLTQVRDFAAAHGIAHYQIDDVAEVPAALRLITRSRPDIIAINGGDGTVHRALTELHSGGYFDHPVPPVAVLPNGRTNLIANDLGCGDDPIAALSRLAAMPAEAVEAHVVSRQLIRLSTAGGGAPVYGMFLGGAGLAEIILFCRRRLYPLGLPNWLAHFIALLVLFSAMLIGSGRAGDGGRLTVSMARAGQIEGRFAALLVTTLDRLLLNVTAYDRHPAGLRMMVIDRRRSTVAQVLIALVRGSLGSRPFHGLHLGEGDEIRIDGNRPRVILDGEYYRAGVGETLTLQAAPAVRFVSFAAA